MEAFFCLVCLFKKQHSTGTYKSCDVLLLPPFPPPPQKKLQAAECLATKTDSRDRVQCRLKAAVESYAKGECPNNFFEVIKKIEKSN